MPQSSEEVYQDNIPLSNLSRSNSNFSMEAETHLMSQDGSSSDIETDEDLLASTQFSSKWAYYWHLVWAGPSEPKDEFPQRFKYLAYIETIPDKFYRMTSHRTRVGVLVVYVTVWLTLWYNIMAPYFTKPPSIEEDPNTTIYSLGCTGQLWKGKNAACGLDAETCPLVDDISKDVYVRCPALCDRSWTYSLVPIGDQRIKYRAFIVGGGPDKHDDHLTKPYRADSYVCGSAVHAGLLSPFYGGCARLSFSSGERAGFLSSKGHYGIEDSIEFGSFFSSSFFFKTLKSGKQHFSRCFDPRVPVLIMNIVLGFPIVFFASGNVIFWVINAVGFWTISLATDPPIQVDSNDAESYAHLLSVGIQRLLPSCFILYALWSCSTKVTLSESPEDNRLSHLSRVFYFYPPFWLGVLNNISFDRLPVDRFTLQDLKEQPNGFIAVMGIVSFVVACASVQVYKIWLAGKFKRYLGIYLSFIFGLVLIANLPGLTLRVHHYILAMLLIPGCCTRGATGLMFQGILLGLFLSGSARWGLAAIAETVTELRRDDPSGSVLPPQFVGFDVATGLLSWLDTNSTKVYDGVSLLVNDVERYVGHRTTSVNFTQLIENSTELSRSVGAAVKDGSVPIYLRLGKKVLGTVDYSDFSNAAVLQWPSGNLTLPKPGIT